MITVEYRLPIPVSLDDYNRALRYVIARVAESTTGVNPGEGVEILVNEPFGPDNELGMPEGGVYTEKVLRFRSRLPALLRRVMPASVTEIQESSWFSNAKGSRCKTVYRNPFLGDRFYLSIESNHLAGIDTEENALDLPKEDLSRRQIIYLDIAGNIPRKLPTEDPSTYVSEKTGIGKLQPGWFKTAIVHDGTGGADEDTAGPSSSVDTDVDAHDAEETKDLPVQQTHSNDDELDVPSDVVSSSCIVDTELTQATPLPTETVRTEDACESASSSSPAEIAGEDAEGVEPTTSPPRSESEDETNEPSESQPLELELKHTMTCYKVVKMEFTGFGMRRFVQRWATRAVIPNGFMDIHRKLFCWMDDWSDLTLAEIEEIENQTAENVRAQFQKHEAGEPMNDAASSADQPPTSEEYEYM